MPRDITAGSPGPGQFSPLEPFVFVLVFRLRSRCGCSGLRDGIGLRLCNQRFGVCVTDRQASTIQHRRVDMKHRDMHGCLSSLLEDDAKEKP